ncbi:hypothetical protein C3486_36170, partial [Streptomyces sp. Ru73]
MHVLVARPVQERAGGPAEQFAVRVAGGMRGGGQCVRGGGRPARGPVVAGPAVHGAAERRGLVLGEGGEEFVGARVRGGGQRLGEGVGRATPVGVQQGLRGSGDGRLLGRSAVGWTVHAGRREPVDAPAGLIGPVGQRGTAAPLRSPPHGPRPALQRALVVEPAAEQGLHAPGVGAQQRRRESEEAGRPGGGRYGGTVPGRRLGTARGMAGRDSPAPGFHRCRLRW